MEALVEAKRQFVLVVFILTFFVVPLRAQEDKPVFWTNGSGWGAWSRVSNYPGIQVRIACGDETTMNNYAVASQDWQLRNGYTRPEVVVWRTQFFDDRVGRNNWTGWMLEHLKAAQISDGWTVVSGRCFGGKVLQVQVKCIATEDHYQAWIAGGSGPASNELNQCFKDPSGTLYPERPPDAFRGEHKPLNASSTDSSNAGRSTAPSAPPTPTVGYYYCTADFGIYPRSALYASNVFEGPYNSFQFPQEKAVAWRDVLKTRYADIYAEQARAGGNDDEKVVTKGYCYGGDADEATVSAKRQQFLDSNAEHHSYAVDWP
jgi:hypothetical protein